MILKVSEGIELIEFEDEVLAIIPNTGKIVSLNATAKAIIERVGDKKDIKSLVSEIAGEYNAPLEAIKSDVEKFISTAIDLKLLKNEVRA